uniref:Sulf extracellular sulfatase n=1 Tax=Clytia hemisphaerica TaxID=252671 RepID=A0A069DML9_9CNID
MKTFSSETATNFLYITCVLLALLIPNTDGRRGRRRKFKRGYLSNRPNIIFIMADDLDVTLGSPDVMRKTNVLLRQQGVTFKNAFTTSPLCCPSRSSILTGRYTHNHHVHSNNKNCSGPGWINKEEKETMGVFMQQAGYQTAYFGKYLNNYDGGRVPPGWDHWNALRGNSRFYNYTLNINGKLKRHNHEYKKDYFTNVITDQSMDYFTKHSLKANDKPLFMVVSHSAPHGPEDGAPHHYDKFPDAKAPRHPNYNFTSLDKHWIIRNTPPLNNVTSQFTDVLHRKRLITLLALDDAIENLFIMLMKTGQLHNTYVFFSSDHGYHLGQFNQVKGKSQPYESDIRIPLYMRGPKIPKGEVREEIALNIDLAPTFLDIAGAKPNKIMDGTSLMDVAVGTIYNSINGRVMKPIWKDSFLVERGKLKPVGLNETKSQEVDTLMFPSLRKIQKLCLKYGYPKPPCTPEKKIVCYSSGDQIYVQKCSVEVSETERCSCTRDEKTEKTLSEAEENRVKSLLKQLEQQFERLKRRIKRHGLRYFKNILKSKQELLQPAVKGQPLNLTTSAKQKINLINQTLATISQKRKLEMLLDKQIERKLQELEYWQKQREKLTKNRNIKKKLEKRLTQKIYKEEQFNLLIKENDDSTVNNSTTTSSCICEKKQKIKKERKKSSKKRRGYKMNCFSMSKKHWKTPPYWTGPEFVACTNTANSTYWCLRTINSTHNFLYCEYWTGFVEYFDMQTDPYQLYNKADNMTADFQKELSSQLQYMRKCRGAKECFLKASQSFSVRRDMLRKWRRYERKKRHGIFVRGPFIRDSTASREGARKIKTSKS